MNQAFKTVKTVFIQCLRQTVKALENMHFTGTSVQKLKLIIPAMLSLLQPFLFQTFS